jgi:hypothetical protein
MFVLVFSLDVLCHFTRNGTENPSFLVILEDFLPKVLFVQKKVVPLHRQYPPRFPKTSEPGRVVYL